MCPPAQTRQDAIGKKEIRCLLVHDHVLLRQGLKRLLDDEPDMQVVAEAGNVAEALQKAFEHRPEVVITDAHMFESAADRTEGLTLRESPYSKVLFLTANNGDDAAPSDTNSLAVRQNSAEELMEIMRRTHTSQRMVLGDIQKILRRV